MKNSIIAGLVLIAAGTAQAQSTSRTVIDVMCVDTAGVRTVGLASVDESTGRGSLRFRYMAQGSPEKMVSVLYKAGSMFQSLVSEDDSVVFANGTNNGEVSNRMSVQVMVEGQLTERSDIAPGNCSMKIMEGSRIVIPAGLGLVPPPPKIK